MKPPIETFGNDIAIFVDPGETTGVLKVTANAVHNLILMSLSDYEMFSFLSNLVKNYKTMFVVEDFRIYAGMSHRLGWNKAVPARIIGAIEFVCQQNGWKVHLTNPTQKKIVKKLDDIKWDMKRQPQNEHEKDVLRLYKRWLLKNNCLMTGLDMPEIEEV